MITLDQLVQIMPLAAAKAPIFIDPLNAAMEEFEINTRLRIAAFLAQLAHESAQLRYMAEIANGDAYNDRADLGNTRPEAIRTAAVYGATPGRFYKGHGPIQITGYDNHKACGEALHLDLVNNPRLLEQPSHGCRAAGWFWQSHNLNKWADASDFDGVCDVVNRGHKTRPDGDSNGYASRLHFYQVALGVLM